MSDMPGDYRDRLDLRAEIARIDRSLDESAKFRAEQNKLAEARKLDRERGLAPWQATALAVGSIAALVASCVSLAKSMGWF